MEKEILPHVAPIISGQVTLSRTEVTAISECIIDEDIWNQILDDSMNDQTTNSTTCISALDELIPSDLYSDQIQAHQNHPKYNAILDINEREKKRKMERKKTVPEFQEMMSDGSNLNGILGK